MLCHHANHSRSPACRPPAPMLARAAPKMLRRNAGNAARIRKRWRIMCGEGLNRRVAAARAEPSHPLPSMRDTRLGNGLQVAMRQWASALTAEVALGVPKVLPQVVHDSRHVQLVRFLRVQSLVNVLALWAGLLREIPVPLRSGARRASSPQRRACRAMMCRSVTARDMSNIAPNMGGLQNPPLDRLARAPRRRRQLKLDRGVVSRLPRVRHLRRVHDAGPTRSEDTVPVLPSTAPLRHHPKELAEYLLQISTHLGVLASFANCKRNQFDNQDSVSNGQVCTCESKLGTSITCMSTTSKDGHPHAQRPKMCLTTCSVLGDLWSWGGETPPSKSGSERRP